MKHNEPDRCPKCGTANSPDFQFCQNCGCQLPAGSKSVKTGRNKKTAAIISCVLVVLIIGGFAGYAALRTNQANRNIDLGNKYLLEGDCQQALQAFEKAAEIKPRNAWAWLGKAETYINLGETDEAEKAYKQALELDPAIPEIYLGLCQILMDRNDIMGVLVRLDEGCRHTGDESLKELLQKIVDRINIQELGRVKTGIGARFRLVYRDGSVEVTLKPTWRTDISDAKVVAKEDGSAEILVAEPGEITVSADIGSITKEAEMNVTIINNVPIAAGVEHSLALREGGTVWAWGKNYNQLAQQDPREMLTIHPPFPIKGLRDVVAVAAGYRHSLALREDGTVWAWGKNYGQLGDGTTQGDYSYTPPVQVKGISDVKAITVAVVTFSSGHSLALKKDGTVWAWGSNYYGQLGDGTTERRYTPVQVKGLSDVAAITTAIDHTLALKKDGTVWAWGNNWSGQLGDGATEPRYTPVQAKGLRDMVAVAAGNSHSLALKKDGTVWAWGSNYYGQLGDGTTERSYTPVQVKGLSNVVAIATGSYHTLGLREDGTVWAWGWNPVGQLGDGTTERSYTAVQVKGLGNVVAIAAGESHNLALREDGTVWAWGRKGSDGTWEVRHAPVLVKFD